ncbi:hypothetical protein CRUP_028985 [Coryphaenoides rupestris]|nr:hypothetical protein CRUP_028985 [Coryphaenoides rupestris]
MMLARSVATGGNRGNPACRPRARLPGRQRLSFAAIGRHHPEVTFGRGTQDRPSTNQTVCKYHLTSPVVLRPPACPVV